MLPTSMSTRRRGVAGALAATTTATLILRADPSYPTVALFHVSLTLRKILKRRAAESPTSRSA